LPQGGEFRENFLFIKRSEGKGGTISKLKRKRKSLQHLRRKSYAFFHFLNTGIPRESLPQGGKGKGAFFSGGRRKHREMVGSLPIKEEGGISLNLKVGKKRCGAMLSKRGKRGRVPSEGEKEKSVPLPQKKKKG